MQPLQLWYHNRDQSLEGRRIPTTKAVRNQHVMNARTSNPLHSSRSFTLQQAVSLLSTPRLLILCLYICKLTASFLVFSIMYLMPKFSPYAQAFRTAHSCNAEESGAKPDGLFTRRVQEDSSVHHRRASAAVHVLTTPLRSIMLLIRHLSSVGPILWQGWEVHRNCANVCCICSPVGSG